MYTLPLKYAWVQKELEIQEKASAITKTVSPWTLVEPKGTAPGATPKKKVICRL